MAAVAVIYLTEGPGAVEVKHHESGTGAAAPNARKLLDKPRCVVSMYPKRGNTGSSSQREVSVG